MFFISTLQQVNLSDNMSTHALLRTGQSQMEIFFRCDGRFKEEVKKILLHAFKWRMVHDRKLYSRPDLEAYETFSSVCADWRKIAQDASFRVAVQTARKQFREKYETIKLKCKTRIMMNDEISCIGSLLDEVYIGTQQYPNWLFLYDPYKYQGTGSSHSTVSRGVDTKRITTVVEANLEKIVIADGIDISSVEPSDDQSGLFCISRTDNSVWFWTRSVRRTEATVLMQFCPCTNITISPVTHERIVMLTNGNALELHNPSTELIQIMFLPDYIMKVNDILCNEEGKLIISYGSATTLLHGVSLIDQRGKVLMTYGNERGSGVNQLNNPSSIALDLANEVLFVVDKGNERIVALDRNMELINVVLDSKYNDAGSPVAVRYSRGCQRLLVAYEKSVELFKINRKLQGV